MKKQLFYIILILTAIIAGCNKVELEDPVDGTPVFTTSLDFGNGEMQSWEAGIDSFYMFTEFEEDNNLTYEFIGRMERETCAPDCRETLTIKIRDAAPSIQGLPNINTALSQDIYPFFNTIDSFDSTVVYDTTFIYKLNMEVDTAITNANNSTSYEWYLNQVLISNELYASQTLDFIEPSTEIMLKVTDISPGDSCVVWQRQNVRTEPADRCAVRIQPNYDPNFFLESLEAIAMGSNDPFIFSWNNGQNNEILSGPLEPSVDYTVTLTDASDCQSQAGYVWSGLSNPNPVSSSNCSAHFNYNIVPLPEFIDSSLILVPNFDTLQLSTVTIVYVDETGRVFRSDRNSQNQNANFNILGVEEYEINEKGYPTKKLDLQFNCTLWDENGNGKTIVDGTAVWGIAYPE